jgi:catechol 2,3-dioxygenase-like lactoylglutathione lyase family enzyme
MKLHSIRLLVADFDACFRFYRDVMGFTSTWGAEGEGYADFAVGSEGGIALFDRHAMAEAVGTLSSPEKAEAQDRLALIFETEDVDSTIEQIRARGANIIGEPRSRPDWGIRVAYLRDPDGNLIEINSPMPHEEWTEELKEEGEKY